jgi:hypothetical protein
MMDDRTSDAANWLPSSAETAVRLRALRDQLGQDAARAEEVLGGSMVRALLSGQHEDGGFGVHSYREWTGAHRRLVSLVKPGIPAGEPRALRAAGTGAEHCSSVVTAGGLVRCHALPGGKPWQRAHGSCSAATLGRTCWPESLVRWQWPVADPAIKDLGPWMPDI